MLERQGLRRPEAQVQHIAAMRAGLRASFDIRTVIGSLAEMESVPDHVSMLKRCEMG